MVDVEFKFINGSFLSYQTCNSVKGAR